VQRRYRMSVRNRHRCLRVGPAWSSPVPAAGVLLCLLSAACFGAMGVFGKLAYEEGATVGTLLAVRFVLAAAVLWAVVAVTGQVRALRALPRRVVVTAVLLGACGYSAQAGLYFLALERVDVSLLSLLLYTFPAIVTVAAVVLGRERADRRRVAALALASGGLVLVLAGAGSGELDPLGCALGLAAAVVYSTYILVSDGVVDALPPVLLSALVAAGATATLVPGAALAGDLQPGALSAAGFGWVGLIALVSTVAAVLLFFAGLRRVGPTTASILSTVEPPVTVLLALLVFGEALGGVQLLGGALVLLAVVALNLPAGRRPWPAPRAPARARRRGRRAAARAAARP
jgi:drug/metabolite transporter (DMT)-like permease